MREPEADRAQCRGGPRTNRVRQAAQRVTPERQLFGERGEQQPGAERECSSPPTRPVSRLRDRGAADQHREPGRTRRDRKSTRLNSSHSQISYAVFCLKKKKKQK